MLRAHESEFHHQKHTVDLIIDVLLNLLRASTLNIVAVEAEIPKAGGEDRLHCQFVSEPIAEGPEPHA